MDKRSCQQLHAPRAEVDRGRSTGITGKEALASVGFDRIAVLFGNSQLHPRCPKFCFRRNRNAGFAEYLGMFGNLGPSRQCSTHSAPRLVASGDQRRPSFGHP